MFVVDSLSHVENTSFVDARNHILGIKQVFPLFLISCHRQNQHLWLIMLAGFDNLSRRDLAGPESFQFGQGQYERLYSLPEQPSCSTKLSTN